MTELTITPKVSDKTARFKGTIAAGEHVAVTIKGGAEWIGEDEGANLTLRVIDLVTKRTLAVFPRPPEVMDEGAEPDAWGSSGDDITCTLNLNSDRMVAAARHMLRVPVMFVLGDTDAPRTLYFRDRYDVEYWPERIGDDVPYDLDAWPKQIDEWMELVDEWTEQMEAWSTALAGKQDTISDLDTIRAGAAKGATAIQSHQDISGKADLVGGKVPQSQLPSYVDDVLEFAAAANFPATGEEGKIYVAKDENKTYRWSGTQYVPIGGSDMTVDPALDDTSTNPVQNKVVKAAVDSKCTVAEAVAEVTRTERNAVYTVTFDPYDDGETTVEFPSFVISDIEWGRTDDDVVTFSCKVDGEEVSVSSERHEEEVNVPLGGSIYATAAYEQAPGAWEYVDGSLGILTKHVTVSYVDGQNAHGLARLVDLPTKTSDLVNDGADGVHPFLTEHQTWSDVKPSGGIPKTDLASAVQTSLGLADTAVQPAEIAAMMPMYPFTQCDIDLSDEWVFEGTAPGEGYIYRLQFSDGTWHLIESGTTPGDDSLIDTLEGTGDETSLVFQTAGVTATLGYVATLTPFTDAQIEVGRWTVLRDGVDVTSQVSQPVWVEDAYGPGSGAWGVNVVTGESSEGYADYDEDALSIEWIGTDDGSGSSSHYTATRPPSEFDIAVGSLPTGVTGKARDCILVIDCTATGAVAPTVTWGTHFHPRTDTATDLAIVEAGKRAVFYISEYAPGEFAVGGWVETAGGSGT